MALYGCLVITASVVILQPGQRMELSWVLIWEGDKTTEIERERLEVDRSGEEYSR